MGSSFAYPGKHIWPCNYAGTFNNRNHTSVEDTSDFLINIMPIMFVPAGVGIMAAWLQLKSMLLALLVIIPVTTFVVMVVTVKVTDLIINSKGGKEDE